MEFEGVSRPPCSTGGRPSSTRYSRNITDAIVNAPIPPSVGFPGSQVINVGRVSGWGRELA
jgi:hypothetical protein